MDITAIIPARGGSKGLPRKNIIKLSGKPLIYYTIAACHKSKYINRIIVSTDDDEIEQIALKYNAEVIRRPHELSDDLIMPDAAVVHSIENLERYEKYIPDAVVFLQPTSPIRKTNDIDNLIDLYLKSNVETVFSAVDIHPFFWQRRKEVLKPINYTPSSRKRRQDSEPCLIENGSIYITNTKIFLENQDRFGKTSNAYIMNPYTLFEIDSKEDFSLIESLLILLKERGEDVIT